jgi:hypothetical protein
MKNKIILAGVIGAVLSAPGGYAATATTKTLATKGYVDSAVIYTKGYADDVAEDVIRAANMYTDDTVSGAIQDAINGTGEEGDNKVFATVATTGNYGDLEGKPTLGTAAAESKEYFEVAGTAAGLASNYATAQQGTNANTALSALGSYTGENAVSTAIDSKQNIISAIAGATSEDSGRVLKIDGSGNVVLGADLNTEVDIEGKADKLKVESFTPGSIATIAEDGQYVASDVSLVTITNRLDTVSETVEGLLPNAQGNDGKLLSVTSGDGTLGWVDLSTTTDNFIEPN